MAKDIFHKAVRNALEKDGWTITHDPYEILPVMYRTTLKVDLGAEKLLAAEKGTEKIAIEVKSFLDESLIYEFHLALGQFINYKISIHRQEPERLLYLAISKEAYEFLFSQELIQEAAQFAQIKLLIFDSITHIITSWKK